LLGRDIVRCAPRDDMVIARFSCEILGPVPVGELELRTRVMRPGRSVELLESVAHAGGRDVAAARAWRVLRTGSVSVPADTPAPPAVPDESLESVPEGWGDGYLSAIDWRSIVGGFAGHGPATVWGRMRYPLVPGEEPAPLERVLIVADSGNGLSSVLDIAKWQFINPELTVHLHREASGEWILIDAKTTISAGGAGLATTVLSDQQGPVGTGAQSLLVAPYRR
jgi:Acyl-CoA thioesterase C-terminal domain/Acyl-CoA thioesterase N-terminal domain